MDMIDKLLQLLECGYKTEKGIENELGVPWGEIGEDIGMMKVRMWVSELAPYLTEITEGRRFYITQLGRDEYTRRKNAGMKGKV